MREGNQDEASSGTNPTDKNPGAEGERLGGKRKVGFCPQLPSPPATSLALLASPLSRSHLPFLVPPPLRPVGQEMETERSQ